MYPHRIRLRGPWVCEAVAHTTGAEGGPAAGTLPASSRMNVPNRWRDGELRSFVGVVRCTRKFGFPGRIDPQERVWLTLSGLTGQTEVWFNGEKLGECGPTEMPAEFEITPRLQPRNELQLIFSAAADTHDLWEEVALEIRSTAFLRRVRAVQRGEPPEYLEVSGLVVGSSDRPLDLYVLVADRTRAQTSLAPTEQGQPFRLQVESEAWTGDREVRVELVDGGVVWYGVEVPVQGESA
jgi:hypothetical protein